MSNEVQTKFNFEVRWSDVDANQHMGNSHYLTYGVQTRFGFLKSAGFPPEVLSKAGLGLAAITDEIVYKKELKFLEPFKVELLCGGMNAKGSRFLFVNRFYDEQENLCAELKTQVLWFDLEKRKSVKPDALESNPIELLPKTDDYKEL